MPDRAVGQIVAKSRVGLIGLTGAGKNYSQCDGTVGKNLHDAPKAWNGRGRKENRLQGFIALRAGSIRFGAVMKPLPLRQSPSFFAARTSVFLAGAVIAGATLAAYHNSFSGPFLLDDVPGIQDNLTLRHLWPIGRVLSPPPDLTTSGRPMVNLSLAINYAFGGTKVGGYHALNLAIHILASLTLFGLVRRTLLRPAMAGTLSASRPARDSAAATLLGLAIALIWALHPLQTEAVTYVIQRAESMMGLFYLLTLYCFVRGADSGRPSCWLFASILCSLLGMATKEVMVSAPLIVLLYDRTFVAGTFREAWSRRRWFYAGLAGSWLLLGYLVASVGGNRNGSVGFGLGVNWWAYELTQFQAVTHYLQLSLWPHPLIFNYGPFSIKHPLEVLPQAVIIVLLAVGSVVSLWRWPAIGFAGIWFFSILAPTSVMPGPSDMIVEHRMYLALAPVVTLLVTGLYMFMIGIQKKAAPKRGLPAASLGLVMALAVPLGLLTTQRNKDYRSELAIWSDTVAKRPDNPAAHDSLGNALEHAGRLEEAIEQHRQALQLTNFAQAHYNLGVTLAKAGRFPEAIEQYQQALLLRPDQVDTYDSLGNALVQIGRIPEAIEEYQHALQIHPDDLHANYNLGVVLAQVGRASEAIEHYEAAARIDPGNAALQNNLGIALAQAGRPTEAIGHYEKALLIDPHHAATQVNLGISLAECGRIAEAVEHYQEALRLDPNSAEAHLNLANVWFRQGLMPEAMAQCEEALRIKPDYAEAHFNLGVALIQTGRMAEASEHFRQVLRINPGDVQAQRILARLQAYQQPAAPLK
ncbi:MAG TPA: tetratricopeptide repeat protein [Opitutaceae bacterium]|jgi:tetratricopeptide (TPR) repeat protein|nr:tetratricopeptide repeat protein [Opitutaceae bacterium]